jgi:hypothetical protein
LLPPPWERSTGDPNKQNEKEDKQSAEDPDKQNGKEDKQSTEVTIKYFLIARK